MDGETTAQGAARGGRARRRTLPLHGHIPARRMIARSILFLGALLFAFAAWAPWFTVALTMQGSTLSAFSLDSSYGVYLLLTHFVAAPSNDIPHTVLRFLQAGVVLWTALSALGVVLAPFAQPGMGRRFFRVALGIFCGWLAVCTVATVAFVGVWVRDGYVMPNVPLSQVDARLGWGSWQARLGWGSWLALAALALTWFTLGVLMRAPAPLRAPATTSPASTSRFRRWRLAGALAVSAGIGLWVFGFLAVPWATVNCTVVPLSLNHFVDGHCGGLDAGDTLSAWAAPHLGQNTWNLGDGIFPLYGVLLAGALLVVIGAWRAARRLEIRVWMTVWLLAATVASAVAYRGAGRIIATSYILSGTTVGAWHVDMGAPLALAGLLAAWAGVLMLDGVTPGGTQDVSLPISPPRTAFDAAAD